MAFLCPSDLKHEVLREEEGVVILMMGHSSTGCTASPRSDRAEQPGSPRAHLEKAGTVKEQPNISVLSQVTENVKYELILGKCMGKDL